MTSVRMRAKFYMMGKQSPRIGSDLSSNISYVIRLHMTYNLSEPVSTDKMGMR